MHFEIVFVVHKMKKLDWIDSADFSSIAMIRGSGLEDQALSLTRTGMFHVIG